MRTLGMRKKASPVQGAQPPVDVDTAARLLAEELRKANDAYLRKIGMWVLIFVGLAAAWQIVDAAVSCTSSGDQRKCQWGIGTPHSLERARILSTVVAVALLGLLVWWHRASGGLRAYVIGVDGRFSTSATQAALWTLALAYALLLLIFHTTATTAEKTFHELDVSYLLLLGGPFAAAGLARASIARKTEEGEVQKVTANVAAPTDVITDDDGKASLIDVQFLVFNLVVLVFFAIRFAAAPTALPNIPLELVGLTSLSALTYTTTKLAQRNAPVVTSVVRLNGDGLVRPGEVVAIYGANFIPPGGDSAEHAVALHVRFGTRDVRVLSDPSGVPPASDRVVVTVPLDVAPPLVEVSVATAAGVESGTYPVALAADTPVITGMTPLPVRPGGRLTITGRFFTRVGGDKAASVAFDGIPVEATTVTDGRLEVEVPPTVLGQTTTVTVRADGATTESEAQTVPVQPAPSLLSGRVDAGVLSVSGSFAGFDNTYELLVGGQKAAAAKLASPSVLSAKLTTAQNTKAGKTGITVTLVDNVGRRSNAVTVKR